VQAGKLSSRTADAAVPLVPTQARDGGRAAGPGAPGPLAAQFVMVTAYAWSMTSTAPRNLPVAAVGPRAAVTKLTGSIDAAKPDAFRFIPAASAAQAEADITSRVAYGAIVVTSRGPRVLIASAASPAAASVLTDLAARVDGVSATPADSPDLVLSPDAWGACMRASGWAAR
jgi:hypothetical protein